MKILSIGWIILSIIFIQSTTLSAQTPKNQTATFEVPGVCGMCQKRIEKAAFIKGVRSVSWDKATDQLTVIFSTKKTTLDQIQQSVASAGHDTPEHKANEEIYSSLPGCCAYRDGINKH